MSVTAGALSIVQIAKTTASLSSAAATGGTGPYTYQWYRSTVSGFTPGAGNLLSGATSLSLSDSGLTPGVVYFYEVIATDTGAGNATSSSAQLSVATIPDQSQNQLSLSPVLGMIDERYNYNTKPAQIDVSQSGSLVAGQAVKIVASAGGIPKVVGCAANSDQVFGIINYDVKSALYGAGDKVEISQSGNVIYMVAVGAINRGVQVQLDLSYTGGVKTITGSSGANIIGWALDQASAAGQLIRIEVKAPNFAFA